MNDTTAGYVPRCRTMTGGTYGTLRTCGRPATAALRAGSDVEPVCARHAAAARQRKWGEHPQPIEPGHLVLWGAADSERAARERERQAERARQRAQAEAAHRQRRALEASWTYRVATTTDAGPPDWEASNAAGTIVYGPGTPAWLIQSPTDAARDREHRSAPTAYTARVGLDREPGLPPVVRLSASSHLDINAAAALATALRAAVRAARKEAAK